MPDDAIERAREIARMRRIALDWRRPALAQIEGPNDLKIYGCAIADDIDRWADLLAFAQQAREIDFAAGFEMALAQTAQPELSHQSAWDCYRRSLAMLDTNTS